MWELVRYKDSWDSWLAQSEGETLELSVASSSPTMSREITLKSSKKKKKMRTLRPHPRSSESNPHFNKQ